MSAIDEDYLRTNGIRSTDEDSDSVAMSRRTRSVAAMRVLNDLAPNARFKPFDEIDHITIGLRAISAAIDAVGIGGISQVSISSGSLTYERLIDHVAQDLFIQIKALGYGDADEKRCQKHARFVVDNLLNRQEGKPFVHKSFDFETGKFSSYEFNILKEDWALDGSGPFVIPDAVACNMFFNALTTNIEDSQAAMAMLIRNQMKRGAYDKAKASAEQHFGIGKIHAAEIQKLRKRVKTSVRSVTWVSDLEPQIKDARSSVENVRDAQAPQIVLVNELIEDGPDKDLFVLFELREAIQRCANLYDKILGLVMTLESEFIEDRQKYGFRYFKSENLYDPTREILDPLMHVPVRVAQNHIDELLESLMPPQAPSVFDLGLMVAWGLKPRMVREEINAEQDENKNLCKITPLVVEAITSDDRELAALFLDHVLPEGKKLLSELVNDAEDHDLPSKSIKGIILYILELFKGEGLNRRYEVIGAGKRFSCPVATGDDLLITCVSPIIKNSH